MDREREANAGVVGAFARSAQLSGANASGFGASSEGMLALFQWCCPWIAPAPAPSAAKRR